MIAVNSWGKKIYIDKDLSGYISLNGDMFTKDGYKFGALTDRGDIYINQEEIGYISDDYLVIINQIESGYVDEEGNLWLDYQSLVKGTNEKKNLI